MNVASLVSISSGFRPYDVMISFSASTFDICDLGLMDSLDAVEMLRRNSVPFIWMLWYVSIVWPTM